MILFVLMQNILSDKGEKIPTTPEDWAVFVLSDEVGVTKLMWFPWCI